MEIIHLYISFISRGFKMRPHIYCKNTTILTTLIDPKSLIFKKGNETHKLSILSDKSTELIVSKFPAAIRESFHIFFSSQSGHIQISEDYWKDSQTKTPPIKTDSKVQLVERVTHAYLSVSLI